MTICVFARVPNRLCASACVRSCRTTPGRPAKRRSRRVLTVRSREQDRAEGRGRRVVFPRAERAVAVGEPLCEDGGHRAHRLCDGRAHRDGADGAAQTFGAVEEPAELRASEWREIRRLVQPAAHVCQNDQRQG
eukprot:1837017-Pleurochrysis_carterae.AAC.8